MNPLKPSTELFLKLAAIVARADRFVSPAGGMLDLGLLERQLLDPEVKDWLKQINRQFPADPALFRR